MHYCAPNILSVLTSRAHLLPFTFRCLSSPSPHGSALPLVYICPFRCSCFSLTRCIVPSPSTLNADPPIPPQGPAVCLLCFCFVPRMSCWCFSHPGCVMRFLLCFVLFLSLAPPLPVCVCLCRRLVLHRDIVNALQMPFFGFWGRSPPRAGSVKRLFLAPAGFTSRSCSESVPWLAR